MIAGDIRISRFGAVKQGKSLTAMRCVLVQKDGATVRLTEEEVRSPAPGPGQLRVKVHAAAFQPDPPRIEFAGVVDMIGVDGSNSDWKVGDRIIVPAIEQAGASSSTSHHHPDVRTVGKIAEFVLANAGTVAKIPENLSMHQAAMLLRHCPTAWNLLINVAKLRSSEIILILGPETELGMIGIQIAKNVVGAKVIAAAESSEKAGRAQELGADYFIDCSTQNLADMVATVTAGRGVDVIYDSVVQPELLSNAFHSLGRQGRLVLTNAGPDVVIDFFHLYDKKITVSATRNYHLNDYSLCLQAAAEAKVSVQACQVVPLSGAVEACRRLEADQSVKVVIDPTVN